MNDRVSVNRVLRTALIEKKMKQLELAKALDTQPATVSVLLHRQRIGASMLIQALNAIGYIVMIGEKGDDGQFEPMWELVSEGEE